MRKHTCQWCQDARNSIVVCPLGFLFVCFLQLQNASKHRKTKTQQKFGLCSKYTRKKAAQNVRNLLDNNYLFNNQHMHTHKQFNCGPTSVHCSKGHLGSPHFSSLQVVTRHHNSGFKKVKQESRKSSIPSKLPAVSVETPEGSGLSPTLSHKKALPSLFTALLPQEAQWSVKTLITTRSAQTSATSLIQYDSLICGL